jgi:hypothetical protein
MDDSTRTAYTEITVRIPDDLARRLGTGGEVERRVLEALALDEFRQGISAGPNCVNCSASPHAPSSMNF